MDATDKKRNAAKAAMEFIEPGTMLGVGTGSTVNFLIEMLPGIRDKIDRVVSSSKASAVLLKENGFEVSTLNEVGDFDLYIDGADESNKRLQLIKGGGGAPEDGDGQERGDSNHAHIIPYSTVSGNRIRQPKWVGGKRVRAFPIAAWS